MFSEAGTRSFFLCFFFLFLCFFSLFSCSCLNCPPPILIVSLCSSCLPQNGTVSKLIVDSWSFWLIFLELDLRASISRWAVFSIDIPMSVMIRDLHISTTDYESLPTQVVRDALSIYWTICVFLPKGSIHPLKTGFSWICLPL